MLNRMYKACLCIAIFSAAGLAAPAQSSPFKKNWIDFNKNGVKDPYENTTLSTPERVNDLVSKMTVEEKVGQLLAPLGWPMYERKGDEILLTNKLKEEVRNRHIGMLWAFMRADPWTERTLVSGLNPQLAAKATNQLQRYVIENSRLGIPMLLAEEAPHGHMAIGATVFPTSVGLSSTWNPALVGEMAQAVALEVRKQGGHVAYGPVLDLLRDPRWSRTEESFGEDPYLISEFGVGYVRGLQGSNLKSGRNVISTLKHFAAYGMPEGGHNGGSSHIGEYEMNEYVYPPFKAAVEAGARTVMASYNEVDGIPCHSNRQMLTDMLRDGWKFDGFVFSDLGGLELLKGHGVAADYKEATFKAFTAGVDADLGSNCYHQNLEQLVAEGKIDVATLDRSVARVLAAKFDLGLFDNPFVDEKVGLSATVMQEHRALARRVARESIVLLKNEKSTLPLSREVKSIAVIGPNADNVYNMLGDYTAPQRDGSVITVLQGIKNHVGPQTTVRYAKGCSIRSESEDGFAEALSAARQSDVVVMVMGGSSARDFSSKYEVTGAVKVTEDMKNDMECGEGVDRATLNLMGKQEKLMQQIAALGKPVVLVLIKGRPLSINWANDNLPAIVDAWYPGMEGGNAIADVLFGDYNPAGRLTMSVPRSVGQLPVFYNTKRAANRSDYTDEKGTPLYPFGYGLSYTQFEYRGISAEKLQGRKDSLVKVTVRVANTGKRDGDEVVQLYLKQLVASHTTPNKRLVAFRRTPVKAGEEVSITFTLPAKSFELYQGGGKWAIEPGKFTLMAGGSSSNTVLEQSIEL